ncbi:Ig-like domain-containing protein [Secundilactobacillus similis]|uniref:Ig-like domain-containing protein n=1 Tax=Secundilactobacillus similis TaxID=414682 RepID=UPI00138F0905|nr:Ig-like domain-containing protein [Secundilactobacillus similis]
MRQKIKGARIYEEIGRINSQLSCRIWFLGLATSTQASAATKTTTVATNSPSLKVNSVYSTSTKITGKATKGVSIIVRNAKNKTIATSTASKKTGAYTVKLSSKLKAGTKIYVYARNTTTKHYFYRIITVQSPKTTTTKTTTTSSKTSSKTTTTKSTTSSKTTSKAASFKVSTPTGTWQTKTYKGWAMKFDFSQKTGLNEYVTYGKKTAHPVKNATYSVDAKTPTFWKVNVKAKNGDKSTFYMRFTAKNKFVLVNSKNQRVKLSVGKAPASYYIFTLQK